MNVRNSLFTSLAALAAIGTILVFQSLGQNPPRYEFRTQEIEERLPDGNTVRRTVGVPISIPDGGSILLGGTASPSDPESQRLMAEEQALAQEVRRLAGNLLGIEAPEAAQAEQKVKIREKLATIFDLQQQRRTHEIAKIEERLGKLKDVLKKRESAKDSIVDRRLETLTGGVDELGWEESLPQPGTTIYPQPNFGQPSLVPYPTTAPRAGITFPGAPSLNEIPPVLTPVPVPPSALPPAAPAPATTPAAPVPAALPVPARR